MSAMIRVKAVVQPGGKVEAVVPELAGQVGHEVEVMIPTPTPAPTPNGQAFLEWLATPRPSTKTPEEWEQFENEFQEMRNEWDR